jgi:hypothetical protein
MWGMKCFLRDGQTRLYIRPDGSWTENVSQAREFQSLVDASEVARDRGLSRALVLITNLGLHDAFEVAVIVGSKMI